MKDPVTPLRDAGVKEESLRPIFRLLLGDSLIDSGRGFDQAESLLGQST